MSTTQQLIAKALSTSSEEEAIACLRMARKKGGSYQAQPTYDYKALAESWQKTALSWKAAYNKSHALLLETMVYKNKSRDELEKQKARFIMLLSFNLGIVLPLMIGLILT